MLTNPVLEAAHEAQAMLSADGAKFCIIGGIAVQRWGEPRFTKDADLSLLTGLIDDGRWVDYLLARFQARLEGARDFALRNRVLLLRASNGVDLDIALAALDFEQRCIERSSEWTLADNRRLRTCSPEDLIVHKAFAARDRDWIDVEGILIRQNTKLDTSLILRELAPLAELKEDATILPRLEGLMKKRSR